MTEVHHVFIQIARPLPPDDPGSAEYGHYIITDGVVTLTDEAGVPLKRGGSLRRGDPPAIWSRKMGEGEDARRVARELLRAKYVATKKGTDFNRTIRYPRWGIV